MKYDNFSIGVILNSFRTDIATALDKAVSVGAQGIQIYATRGDLSPEEMTPAKRREFLDSVKSRGLIVSALCGDLGQGFGNPEKNDMLIHMLKIHQKSLQKQCRFPMHMNLV